MPLSLTDPVIEKKLLRTQYLQLRGALSPEQKQQMDEALRQTVLALPEFQSCGCLLCYAPTRGEIDLLPLARQALAMGKEVAFPISHTEDCTLTFHTVTSLDQLTVGAYGILEPPKDAPKAQNHPKTLCLVPALSFDREGYRLGYGKGYYDRFLPTFRGMSVGLIYSDCLSNRLPRNETDRPVHRIFTEKGEPLPNEPQSEYQGNLSK